MGEREKLMRDGLLLSKQRERDSVETKIDRCVKDLNYYSFPAVGIESIEPDKVLQAAKELKELLDRWKKLQKEIKDIEAEIG